MRDDCELKNKSSNSSLEVEGEREWRITNVLFVRLRAPYRDTVFISTKTKKYMYMCELYACSVQWMFHRTNVFFFFCYLLICDVKSSIIKLKKTPVSEFSSLCILHIHANLSPLAFSSTFLPFKFSLSIFFCLCFSVSLFLIVCLCFVLFAFLHTKIQSIL